MKMMKTIKVMKIMMKEYKYIKLILNKLYFQIFNILMYNYYLWSINSFFVII